MNAPEVSVVMSIYNDSRYLRGAMDSVLNQQGVDFEFVVVNDGATDDSPAIVAEYAAKDPRVRLIHQHNAGLTRALIRGCQEARGCYIARQDADDLSMPGRLSAQTDRLQRDPRLVFVSSWAEVIGPEDEPLLLYQRPADPEEATRQLLFGRIGPPGHGSVMFRRESYDKVGGYRPELYYAQDSDLWLRMGESGKIAYVQKVLYQYRISQASMSGGMHYAKIPFARLLEELYAARRAGQSEAPVLARAPKPNHGKDMADKPTSQDRTLYFIGRCLITRRDPRALKYLIQCIRANPRNFRAWIFLMVAAPLTLKKKTISS